MLRWRPISVAPGLRRLVAGEPGADAGIGGSRHRLLIVGEFLIDPGLTGGIRVTAHIIGAKLSRKLGAADAGIGGSQNRLRAVIDRFVDAGGFARGIPYISSTIAAGIPSSPAIATPLMPG